MDELGSSGRTGFDAYVAALIEVIGHADRAEPLRDYCLRLMMPVSRKSVEPLAAVTAPARVSAQHQSLLHFVGQAPWSDDALIARVRDWVLPRMIDRGGPITAWIIDDTGFPKKGTHSVGVTRQYCGQLGKQDNCQVAVSLSIANEKASLPVAWRLYLPEAWAQDHELRRKARIPEGIGFQTKPQIALDQIRAAVATGTPAGVILADAGYGADGAFRSNLSQLGLDYVVGVQPTLSVWRPGEEPLPPKAWSGTGRPPSLMRRSRDHKPLSAKALAQELPADAWQSVTWREGSNFDLASRFAAMRLRPASRDYNLTKPRAEEWLLIEWPQGDAEPLKYWLSTLPADTPLRDLVAMAKLRWRIERDYRELKQELGLGHYEGRGWRGFHHHASLCIAAYGFLISEREAISPSAPAGARGGQKSPVSRGSRSHAAADPTRAARSQFDRHSPPPDHRRPRSHPAPMSLLRPIKPSSSISFMTQ
ncbi:IS701 family transposase [Bosea spartocytisi]|uniref:IS701 family transposase n=1 Tax=Bosea spartocytisi TaxID=2773451 RepID=UPI00384A5279